MGRPIVPNFYLYGEPHRSVADGFVHVESLDDRSRPSEWTIQPHAHAELAQIILIAHGGGSMQAEAVQFDFVAPALLIVPPMTIHGFTWQQESSGFVITMASEYLASLFRIDAELRPLFDAPFAIALGEADAAVAEAQITGLMRELGWIVRGHRAAVDASLLGLLVLALRGARFDTAPEQLPSHHARLVARLRERIEQRFRLREPVEAYAKALGASVTTLRVACAKAAGASPTALLDQRALLEAKRALLYSSLTIAEIGYSIGMADPAYFSRFFTRHVGRSPREFRIRRA